METKPRLIRYLENGEYKYASVKDVGDLNSLLTDDKSDVVSAINYLFRNGGASGVSPETRSELDDLYGKYQGLSNSNESISAQIIDVQSVIDTVSQQATSLETSQAQLEQDLSNSLKSIQDQKDEQELLKSSLASKLDSAQYSTEYQAVSNSLKEKANQLALDATNESLGVVKNTKIPEIEGAVGQKLSITTYEDAVGVNKWVSSVFPVNSVNLNTTIPDFDMIRGSSPTSVDEIADGAVLTLKSGSSQITHLFTRVFLKTAKTIALNILFDDSVAVYMNGASIYQSKYIGSSTRGTASMSLRSGWNTIEILHGQATGTPVLDLGVKISSQVDKLTSVVGVGDRNETRLSRAETAIIQTTSQIALKASQTDVTNLGNRVSSAEGELTIQAGQIASKVSQSVFDGYSQKVLTAESNITQLSDSIASKVSKTDYDNLNSKVTSQGTSITQLSDSITSKANKTDVDGLSGRVTTTETAIVQANNAIALKASQSSLNSLSGRLDTAESSITAQADQIALKVAKTDMGAVSALNALRNSEWITDGSKWSLGTGWSLDKTTKFQNSNTMKQIQSGASVNNYYALQSESISCTVGEVFTASIYAMTDDFTKFDQGATIEVDFFNSSNTRISYPSASISFTANSTWQRFSVTGTAPTGTTYAKLRVHVGRNGRLWVARPMLQSGVFASIFTPHVEELATDLIARVASAETSITQTNSAVALKANSTDVYTKTEANGQITTSINSAKSEIKATTDSITSTVSSLSSTVDGIDSKVTSQATEIKQTKDDISLNVVKKDNVITSINASSEGIKMVASKIDLVGAVTINALDTATKNKVNNALDTTAFYNGVKIDANSGIVVTKSDNKVRTKLNATEGFKIQKSLDGTNFTDVLYADTNGVLHAKGLDIDADSSIGGTVASTVVNNASSGALAQSTVTSNLPVWGRASNINNDGTFNTDKLNGKLTDNQILNSQVWNTASTNVGDMVSDLKISPLEKSQLARDWEAIKAEYTQITAMASALSISQTAFASSYTALDGTAPKIATDILVNMSTTYTFSSTTTRDAFKNKFTTYYVEKEKLRKAISDAINSTADTAKTRTDDMISDMKVTALEKSQLSRDWESIKAEYAQLSAQASALSVSNTAYVSAYTALDGTTPRIALDILSSMSTTYSFSSTSSRDLFKTQLNNYFTESQKLRKAIGDKIQSNVENVSVGGRNILPNSSFSALSASSSITSKHDNLYADYYGGYNGGVTNPTTSYHAHVDTNTFGYPVYEYNESDGSRGWKGISVDLTTLVTEAGEYRLSLDAFQTLAGGKITGGFYYTKRGTTTTSFHSGQYSIDSSIGVNTWSRSSVLVKLNDDVDWTKSVSFYFYGYGFSSNAIVYMKKPKLEKGNVSSEWTPSNEDVQRMIDTASSSAKKANDMLTDMSSDSKITPTEKVQLKKEWATISAEKSSYESLATTYGITTEKTSYVNSYNSLNTALNGTGGVLLDMQSTSTVVGSTFRSTFDDYYDKKALLIKKVNETSRSLANSAQTTANSKAQTFTSQPTTPYYNGDIWVQGASGDVMHCVTTRTSGSYNASDWSKSAKYTDDTMANTATELATAMSSGKMIYTDPTFKNGNNGITLYNNGGNGAVTLTRISKPSDAPTTSAYAVEIKTTALANPSWGGFQIPINSRSGAKFIVKMIAKIPVGYTLATATNAMGTGYTDKIISSNQGTGKYEEYIRIIQCGVSGSFSNGGHFYLTGGATPTTANPLVWNIAYITAYDVADIDTSIYDMLSDLKVTPLEKNQLARDWEAIKAEYTNLISQASSVSVSSTAFANAYNTLNTTTPRIQTDILAEMSSTYEFSSTSARDTFKNQMTAYFSEREKLRKAVSDAINATAGTANSAINTNKSIWDKATNINSDGTFNTNKLSGTLTDTQISSSSNWNSARSAVLDMSDDNKLTPVEKQSLKIEFDQIIKEKVQGDSVATTYGITTEKTNYGTSYTTLYNYVNPLLSSLTTTSTINGSTLRAYFNDYYDKATILSNAISSKAKLLADLAQSTADAGLIKGSISKNPLFNEWGATHANYPTGMNYWGTASIAKKETSNVRDGSNALRFSAMATNDAGATLSSFFKSGIANPKYLVVEMGFQLVSGSPTGAGVLLDWSGMASPNRAQAALQEMTPENIITGKWYNASKVFKRPSDNVTGYTSMSGYLMANYSNLGSKVEKDLIYDRLVIREATIEEIKAYESDLLIIDMSSDGKVTPVEKVQLKKEWATVSAEKTSYEGLATTFVITTEKTNYINSYNNLNTLLNGSGGVLLDMTSTSTITASTFRATFDDYYDKKALLIRKINETSRTLANNAQGTANTANTTANTVTSLTNGWKAVDGVQINGGKIYANTITSREISVSSLSAISANIGNITAGKITGIDIESSNFKASGYTRLNASGKGDRGTMLLNPTGLRYDYTFDSGNTSYPSGDGYSIYDSVGLEIRRSVGGLGAGTTKLDLKGLSYSGSGGSYNGGFSLTSDDLGQTVLSSTGGDFVVDSNVSTFKKHVRIDGNLDLTQSSSTLTLPSNVYYSTGTRGAINMNNSDITGANAIVFNDPSDGDGEGLLFLKDGKTSGSVNVADYDVFRGRNGSALFNDNVMLHEGDVQIQSGYVTMTPKANTPTDLYIKFPKAFSGTPRVMVTPNTTVAGYGSTGTWVSGYSASGADKDGFTMYITRTNTTPTGMMWVAVYGGSR